MQGTVKTIVSPEKRTGVSQKTGKPWTIAAITVEVEGSAGVINADTFDKVELGDTGTLERKTYQKQDGSEGYSYTFKKPYVARGGGMSQDDRELLVQTFKAVERVEKLIQQLLDNDEELVGVKPQPVRKPTTDTNSFTNGEPLPEYEGGY